MTEAEWLACEDPEALVRLARGQATVRKLRLLAVACCRLVWGLLDERGRTAVRRLGRIADDPGNVRVSRAAFDAAQTAFFDALGTGSRFAVAAAESVRYACSVSPVSDSPLGNLFGTLDVALERSHDLGPRGRFRLVSDVIRDAIGNPFRPAAADPAWLTSTVVALAAGVYDERAFDRLPILADALQDAGCEDAAVLDHCRGPGPHARGCWVVDMLLGKS